MLKIDISTALNDFTLAVSIDFPSTGISAVFGQSGSGKTTMLRCIAGFHTCTGNIRFGDEHWLHSAEGICVPPHRRKIGYVFQDARLFSHLTVLGNLRFAEKRAGNTARFTNADIVDMLDLQALLQREIQDLSGGERQRVALGRTLLTQPKLLMLDEPLSALDQSRKLELLPYIITVCQELAIPALFVSHAIDEVAQLAGHTLVLDAGKVQIEGSTLDVLEHPGLQSLTGRYESGTVLFARFSGYDAEYQLARVSCEGQTLVLPMVSSPNIGSESKLYVRARDVSIATTRPVNMSIRNILQGSVLAIHTDPATPFAELSIAVGKQVVHARVTRAAVAELDLGQDREVYALIKSVSFDL